MVPEQMELLLSDLDGAAAILRNQDLVAFLHAHGHSLSILVKPAGADSQDFGLVEFLHRAFGEEDATGGAALGLDSLNQDAVQERDEGADGLEGGCLITNRVSLEKFELRGQGDMRACTLLTPEVNLPW
jgi:hypothetical protein